MTDDERRIRRPKLPRTAARRSLAVLFVPPAASGAGVPGTNGSASASTPWNDVIARSVELGYRVIDDYVRQGEQIARTFGSQAPAAPAMAPSFVDPQDFARRMSQYAMDVTALWLQMLQGAPGAAPWMGAFTGFAAPPAGSGTTPPPSFAGFPAPTFAQPAFAAPPTAPAPHATPTSASPPTASNGGAPRHDNGTQPAAGGNDAEPLRVAVAISSVALTEVVLELRPDAQPTGVAVHALRDGDKPRIQDVTVSCDDATRAFTIRIRVPSEQPAGVYRAAVTDAESGLSIGSLAVRVLPE